MVMGDSTCHEKKKNTDKWLSSRLALSCALSFAVSNHIALLSHSSRVRARARASAGADERGKEAERERMREGDSTVHTGSKIKMQSIREHNVGPAYRAHRTHSHPHPFGRVCVCCVCV